MLALYLLIALSLTAAAPPNRQRNRGRGGAGGRGGLTPDVQGIINGDEVDDDTKWPWQCSLQTPSGWHFCGAVVITDNQVLTAAHCVHDKNEASLKVRCGSNTYTSGGTLVGVADIKMHEDYVYGYDDDLSFHPNDVAILTLSETFQQWAWWDGSIREIPLAPPHSEHANNNDCWITGFGRTDPSTPAGSVVLQEAEIDVITNVQCKQDPDLSISLNDGNVCISGSSTACQGDSGGPLVCKVNGQYELVGLASYVFEGCGLDRPAVYTRVAHFFDWIQFNV